MSRQRQRRRRFWRRLKSLLWTAVFLLLVGAAVLTGLGRLLAPYADQLTPHMNAYLSQRLGVDVRIGKLAAGWNGQRPHLALESVAIGTEIDALQLDQVRLQFDPVTWFKPGRNSVRVEVIGAELALRLAQDGSWRLMGQGLGGGGNPERQSENIAALLQSADVQLVDARIRLSDENSNYGRIIALPRVSIVQVPDSAPPADSTAQVEQQRGKHFQLIARVQPDASADAEAIVRLDVYAGQRLQSVRGYLQADQQALQPWLTLLPEPVSLLAERPGTTAMRLWFDWQQDSLLELSGHVQLAADTAFIATDLRAQFDQKAWVLSLENLAFAPNSLDSTWLELGSNAASGWSLVAGRLPLSAVQQWQRWLQPELPDLLALQGDVDDLSIAIDAAGRVLHAHANATGLYLDLRPAEQRITGTAVLCGPLTLAVAMRQQLGVVDISSTEGVCDIPGISKAPYLLDALQLSAQLEQQSNDWFLHWLPSAWDSGDFDLKLAGSAALLDGRVWLDMHAQLDSILASLVKDYWPYQENPKGAGEWIARSMQGGYWRDIEASVRGFADQWPLVPAAGQFIAAVTLDDVALHYARNWPPASQVNARVHLWADGLETVAAEASLAGIPVDNLTININNLIQHPLLGLSARLRSDTSAVLDLLAAMPLGGTQGLSAAERDFELIGATVIEASVGLDLKQRSRLTYAQGVAHLEQVSGTASLLKLSDISGDLRFDDSGIQDSELQALWGEYPATLSWVRTAQGPEIQLAGDYPAAHIVATALPDQPSAQNMVAGSSAWLLRLLLARPLPRVILASDLLGTELRLPAPLEKFAPDTQPLWIDWELGDAERVIRADYGQQLQLKLLENAARNLVGGSMQWRLPESNLQREPVVYPGKFLVEGQTEVFDPLGWATAISSMQSIISTQHEPAAAAVALQPELHLQTGQLMVERRAMGSARMDYIEFLEPGLDGESQRVRLLDLEGENIAGEVRLGVKDDNWVIDTNLQRLNIPKPLVAWSGASGRQRLLEDKPPAEDSQRIDWLSLYLICDDMTWQGIPMGQTRIEILPRVDGMVIDTLEARSEVMTVTGSGGWQRTDEGVYSNLKLRLDADNAGDLLAALGYERLVEDSQITIALDTSWPGSIGELNLTKLEGTLSLEAGSGVVPKAAPGAGRVLGLISLQALPRRLFLDFSDVFAEGLDFDYADGLIEFSDGIAHTDGIVINASAADIMITGDTDLAKGEYDQLITVTPGLGVTLPVLGAIAGGPIGAGAGLALQGIFGSSLGGLAEIKYAVTGPWDQPELRALADAPTVTQPPDEQPYDDND